MLHHIRVTKKRMIPLILMVWTTIPAWFQKTEQELSRNERKTDTSFIERYDHKFTAKLYFSNDFLSVLHHWRNQEQTYKANRPLSIGAGFNYKKFGLAFSYGFNLMKSESKGRTQSVDIQYSYYGRKFFIDGIGQWYRGFYNDRQQADGNYLIYGSMKVLRIGLSGIEPYHLSVPERFAKDRPQFGLYHPGRHLPVRDPLIKLNDSKPNLKPKLSCKQFLNPYSTWCT